MVDLDELERLVAQAPSTTWSVVDGHYPCFRNIEGPSFPISCVMWATDFSEIDYVRRKTELELIAALRNAAEELIRDARRWRHHCYIESQTSRSPNP
jgi:hypothetical protein